MRKWNQLLLTEESFAVDAELEYANSQQLRTLIYGETMSNVGCKCYFTEYIFWECEIERYKFS